jgi:hypothetical protein
MIRNLKDVMMEDFENTVKFIDENAFSLDDKSYK